MHNIISCAPNPQVVQCNVVQTMPDERIQNKHESIWKMLLYAPTKLYVMDLFFLFFYYYYF